MNISEALELVADLADENDAGLVALIQQVCAHYDRADESSGLSLAEHLRLIADAMEEA